jgi:hypothetical protein
MLVLQFRLKLRLSMKKREDVGSTASEPDSSQRGDLYPKSACYVDTGSSETLLLSDEKERMFQ